MCIVQNEKYKTKQNKTAIKIIWKATMDNKSTVHVAETLLEKYDECLRRNPPEVQATSGQKPCTKIIYIVLQTSVGLC